jgi:1-acyl-sn-glycerol-3-phosphate acyltransferase
MHPGIYIALFIVLLLALAGWLLLPHWRRYRAYAKLVATCGYLPDPPKPRAVRLLHIISKCITGVQVGRKKVIGAENFPLEGPAVIALNHPHYADGFVVAPLLPRPARYMGAEWVLSLPLGIGPLLARCGGFAVDTTSGKGGPAREAAIKVLTTGQQLVLCPEGQTTLHGATGPFKRGVISIAREAGTRLGTPVPIIPVFLRYGRYPGEWVTRMGHAGYFWLLFNAWYYRRGVTVTVGKPVYAADLSADDHEAAEQLRERMLALDPARTK